MYVLDVYSIFVQEHTSVMDHTSLDVRGQPLLSFLDFQTIFEAGSLLLFATVLCTSVYLVQKLLW